MTKFPSNDEETKRNRKNNNNNNKNHDYYYEFVWQQARNSVRTDCLNDLLSRGTRRIAVRAFSFDFSFFPRTVNRAKEREKKKKFMVVAGSILTRPGNKLIGVRVGIPFDTAATDETLRGASEMIN